MYLDPVDFFPGYDPYYCCRQQAESCNFFRSLCIHLLTILLTVVICAGAFYYYENNKPYNFDFFQESPSVLKSQSSDTNIDEILKEVEKMKESIKDTLQWKNQLTDLFARIYNHQDATITRAIDKALDLYDSDKVGMFDYAATYACGSIFSTPDTFAYPANKTISYFNLLNIDLLSNPEAVLQPGNLPGNCFAFYGSAGRIRIKLGKKITVKSVTMDHIKLREDASSAPRDFEVFGLENPLDVYGVSLGKFTYDIGGRPYQTFPVHTNSTNKPFEYVELNILNNYGRQEFTCVYRFRVHNTYL